MVSRALLGAFALAVLVAVAWGFSRDRRAVDWRLVGTGVALQIAFALFVLDVPVGRVVLDAVAGGFVKLLSYVDVGVRFVFGAFADRSKFGFVFALHALPTIVFFSALTNVLYHLGVMQRVVLWLAWAMTRVMKVSGAETTAVSANVFVGMVEAPLTIRPYLEGLTESELMTVMVGGMAHVAGSVMGAYVGLLGGDDPVERQFYAKHFLTASLMAAPATMVIAKILVPETGVPVTRGSVALDSKKPASNVIEAAASGAADGMQLSLLIGAMLIAFVALIALFNAPLQWAGGVTMGGSSLNDWLTRLAGGARPVELSIQTLLGGLLAPVAWLIGVPWHDAPTVASFIGEKVVINEFVAYADLSRHLPELAARSRVIATYALCGFANFTSIAIQIGGIGGLAPGRRSDIARLGLRAVLGGSLATFMTATIAGVLSG
jgi:CNT family concentrative nucleoside transporter